MTRAPASARLRAHSGAATACSSETTRRPSRGNDIDKPFNLSCPALVPALQPSLHVAVVRSFRVGYRQQKAFLAIEKARSQHVNMKESVEAVANAGKKRHASPLVDHHFGAGR